MQFDFTLGANQSQQLDVRGKFFKCTSATGKVRVRTNTGDSIDLLPGQGVWNVDYQWLNVQDRTGATNTGTILAGDFDFHDDRISGTVDVVDGGKARTLAGVAHMGAINVSGDVSNAINLQLWNPAGSGKNLVLEQITVASSVANGFRCLLANTQLATFYNAGASKKAGGALPVAVMRYELNPGQLGTASYMVEFLAASQPFIFKFSEPIILPPGSGINIAAGQVNTPLAASFEWYEDPI